MREIKFRGLDYYGKWQYGNYSKKFLPSRDWTGKKTSEPSWVHYITDYEYDLIGVKPDTVGQFTGFKDKNGQEIYEGDKVSFIDNIDTESGYMELDCIGIVEWDKDSASFYVTNRLSAESYEILDAECVIVGNKYETEADK